MPARLSDSEKIFNRAVSLWAGRWSRRIKTAVREAVSGKIVKIRTGKLHGSINTQKEGRPTDGFSIGSVFYGAMMEKGFTRQVLHGEAEKEKILEVYQGWSGSFMPEGLESLRPFSPRSRFSLSPFSTTIRRWATTLVSSLSKTGFQNIDIKLDVGF